MPTPTPIERAYQHIQQGQVDDARAVLADLLKANPKDAMAWALAARLAPDPDRCAQALRQVAELSADNTLAEWAIHQLNLVVGGGRMDSTAPPLLGDDSLDALFRAGAGSPQMPAPPQPSPAPAPAPVRLSRPLPSPETPHRAPGGTGFALRQVGGTVAILGVLIIAAAVVSQPVFDVIAATGILPGWIGITLIGVGGALVGIGYLLG